MTTHFDVVIIGSGPGGGASALALSTAGISVLILESGPQYDPNKDYNIDKPNWEAKEFPEKTTGHNYSFAPMQTLSEKWDDLRSWNHITGRMINSSERAAYKYHHVRGVGGASLKFSAEAHRINPLSMKMKSDFGVAADWPMSSSELNNDYEKAEHYLAVSGLHRPQLKAKNRNLLPPHELSYASQILGHGAKKLGWDWQSNTVAIPSKAFVNRPSCNYCGQCGRGCSRQDKGSADIAFIRPAINTGKCIVKANCHVTRIIAGSKDKIDSVEYSDGEGKLHQIRTRVLIVAAGAIMTPKLLLTSNSQFSPDGLANESGQVGKNFMETLFWTSSALHPERLDSFRGIPSDAISWHFNNPKQSEDIIGGYRLSSTTLEANFSGPSSYALRVVPGWGKQHLVDMKNALGHVLSVGAVGESLPNKRSYISLDNEQTDAYGYPIAKIHSHLPDMELNRLRYMANSCRELLAASGAEKPFEEYGTHDMFSATHVFGTCRMGESAENSVVNAFGQSHRWKNLFIVDASVFPSSGGGESPSLTISALAFRTAKYIKQLMLNKII